MSKPRLESKLRQNAEFPAVTGFLNKIGFKWQLHGPTGRAHPFLTITLPDGRMKKHHINSTPRNGGNPKAALSKLRRKLREWGYDL